MGARVERTGMRVETRTSSTRQTPRTDFGSYIQNGLHNGYNAVASGVGIAAPFIPGGAILNAAVQQLGDSSNQSNATNNPAGSGGNNLTGGGTNTNRTASGGGTEGNLSATTNADPNSPAGLQNRTEQMMAANQSFSWQYLQIQDKMQSESRQYQTVSNILKVRHDNAKNAIANIR